ncbi:MAG: hypothetical protein QOD53_1145 [Thermoleophilaceae bacterium]|jgi:short subunit dehydrogenase-like uncharacterized protein|nr:hypothetical protein [Thermoleophilaceae bacterium]
MAGRIVLFGATGYTGRLVADSLIARGERPVLAARNVQRLREMGDELGGLEIAVADVSRPESVRDLVERGDVLVSTVGPFARWGDAAAEAAVAAGAHYLDSTGEPPFIRRVFEEYGSRAQAAGCGMVTAFGYDWVPGNLAGALALREAGDSAARVAIGYFMTGDARGGMSGGTQASTAGVMLEPSYAWRDGSLQTERAAKRLATFDVDGKRLQAVSVGSSEHFSLPRVHRGLREVDVYLGWFGPLSRPLQAMSAGLALGTSVPGVKAGLNALASRFVKGSTGGPDAEARSKSGSHILAVASDAGGKRLSEVRVTGVNGYDFTGRILAWGASTVAARGMQATGALGPVEAFGLDELEAGCREAGLDRA